MGRFAGAKAVFFDVDNTLYDFEDSMRFAFEHLHRSYPDVLGSHGVDRLSEAYWAFYRGYPEREKVDLINRDPDLFRRVMWAGALKRLGLDDRYCDPEGFARELTDDYMRHRPEHWRAAMYDGARETLVALRERGTIIGAITNGPGPVQRPKLEAFRYREHFDEPLVFVSGEFGEYKPHPSIFLAAAKAAGVAPEECVMVGDAREYDMPAKAVGFGTILFDGKSLKPDCAADPYPPDVIAHTYHDVQRALGLR